MQISERKRTLMLVNIIISCVATTLLMTAMNTALVSIRTDLGIEYSTAQWLISGFSLVMGIVMPMTAFFTRRFKTKSLYLTALAIVGVGLILGMVSNGFVVLMVARALQGCGNGILLSMSQVVILSIFPKEKRGSAMGWYGLAVGAAPVIAPALGGVLVDSVFGWRGIFAVVLIFVIIAFVMALFVFDNVLETAREKLDITSFIESIVAFGGITLGIGNMANYGISNLTGRVALAVGIIGAVMFVYRELKLDKPFLNLRVFKSKIFNIGLIEEMLCYLIMMGVSILMPLYVQQVMGYSATTSGLVILPGALCNAVVSPFAGRIYDKTGMRRLAITGGALIFVSTFAMCFAGSGTTLIFSAGCYVVRSVAFALVLMPFVTWGTAHVEGGAMADGTALMSSLRTIAGSIGSAVFAGVMTLVASGLTEDMGEKEADMSGIRVAFFIMTLVSVVVLVLAIVGIKDDKDNTIDENGDTGENEIKDSGAEPEKITADNSTI